MTFDQKKSVINMLLTIGVCDGISNADKNSQNEVLKYLNTYIRILGVRKDQCMSYMQKYGYDRIVSDLQTISQSQKELLIIAACGMITCNGRPSERKVQVVSNLFEKIGISDEKFVETISKSQDLMEYFMNK